MSTEDLPEKAAGFNSFRKDALQTVHVGTFRTKRDVVQRALGALSDDTILVEELELLDSLEGRLHQIPPERLQQYSSLLDMEIDSLKSDRSAAGLFLWPWLRVTLKAIGLVAAWSAIWGYFWGFDVFNIARDVLFGRLRDPEWVRGIAALIFVIGGFLGIAYYLILDYGVRGRLRELTAIQRTVRLFLSLKDVGNDA